jgi:translation initiation factor 4A
MTDASEFITPSDDVKSYESFDHMTGLSENLLRGIYSHGFTKPSDIQTKGIMPIVEGHDIMAQAQSGTGKTGTFVIGGLSRIDPSIPKPQVLIIVHVRELAQQIEKVAKSISTYMGISIRSTVGGTNLRDDISELKKGVQFIVGTPGRIYDLMTRNVLDRSEIRLLIMDEADHLLKELFYEQVVSILKLGFPAKTRVALFSATMPEPVRKVASDLMGENSVRILISPGSVTLRGIKQYYIPLEKEDHKFECIVDLYKSLSISQAVIFCNTRRSVEKLNEKMSGSGYPVSFAHGELEKSDRERRMRDFLGGDTRLMISTDMIARGIDVQQISLVINYEIPENEETYVHRIGRAGRFGRKGVTINLVLPEEIEKMNSIARKFEMTLEEMPMDLSNIL